MTVSNRSLLYFCIIYFVFHVESQSIGLKRKALNVGVDFDYLFRNDLGLQKLKYSAKTVKIQLYYECLCPGCRDFDTHDFKTVVQKLHAYLEIHTYPYGNAKTIKKDSKYEIICQHGPAECYGNKLHACALELIRNSTSALLFNSCMMEGFTSDGSDNVAADRCGKSMGIDASGIKECAGGEKGFELLKYYGEESDKVGYSYVPYILLNGKETDGDSFMKTVCAAFDNPPPPCTEV